MGKESIKLAVNNKKAYHDYFIDEKYGAGIELSGTEAKSTRMGKCSVKEAFVKTDRGEVYVCGMHISSYERGSISNKDPLRVRRLSLYKYEIMKLNGKIAEKGYTLVPLHVYFKGSLVKVGVGLTRGKEFYDKRADTVKKDQRRELEEEFKVKSLRQGQEREDITRIGSNKRSEVEAYIDFTKEAEGPKSTLRTAWTAEERQESTAGHSWRLVLFAGVIYREFLEPGREKVPMMCLAHDLGERYSGDVSTALRLDAGDKLNQEREDAQRVYGLLPKGEEGEVPGLWEGYSQGTTPEVRPVKAPDKAEAITQHSQGRSSAGFDYGFNLEYEKGYFEQDERLEALRSLTDAETGTRVEIR